jgi:phosphoribosylformimino-5-aminoimidazole carboxamide ribotide isomerase
VGTETLESLQELERICRIQSHVVVSLDYKGELLARDESLRGIAPRTLVDRVCQAGAAEIIYLDIKRVGTSSGTSSETMETVISTSRVPVLVGGGIRNAEDIEELDGLGVDGVLVATCIHSGELTVQDIEKLAG